MDLSNISQEQQQAEIYRNGAALKKSMQIDSQLLLKAMLFHCGDKQKLLLTAHHLIIDGVSWRILLQDFNALLKERTVQLPVKTDSVQRWTAALDAFITNDLKKEIEYWNARQTDFSLPADYYHALPSKGPNITSIHAELTAKETEKVMIQSNATRVTKAAHILLAALLLTLESKLSQPYIPIVLEGHGRNEFDANIDVSRTIGWFTSMYPASFKAGRGDIALTLDIIRESLDQIPNEGLGYSALAFKSKQIADGLMKKIRFNYLGELDNALTEADFTISADDTGEDICLSNPLTCLLDVVLIIVNGKLLITFTYDEALLRSHLIRELLDTFIAELRRVLDYCCSEERDIRSTDFETVSLSDEDLDLLLFS
jgi:non-ribosomal peptide synthase protein (TIGR01720 family)